MSAILPFVKIDSDSLLAKLFTPHQIAWIQAEEPYHARSLRVFALAAQSAAPTSENPKPAAESSSPIENPKSKIPNPEPPATAPSTDLLLGSASLWHLIDELKPFQQKIAAAGRRAGGNASIVSSGRAACSRATAFGERASAACARRREHRARPPDTLLGAPARGLFLQEFYGGPK